MTKPFSRRWWTNPDDLRYRVVEMGSKALPIVLLYVATSGVSQCHTNSVFDGNEIQNILQGIPVIGGGYALMKWWKLV